MRGLLIVFEGLDRCGKTTQSSQLVSSLENCIKLNFPDRTTTVGGLINSYLQGSSQLDDHAVHLLFSANRWELKGRIAELLEKGTHVVVDRYAYSGVAYSSAKGLDVDWCKACDAGLLKPDLVIYLKLNPEDALGRGDYGAERYERLEFQTAVQRQFDRLLLNQDNVVVLDATQESGHVASEVTTAVATQLSKEHEALSRLWS